MSLADSFPESIKEKFASRNIDIGKALFIEIPEFQISYKKYWVIVSINTPRTFIAGVVINTEINTNVAHNEYLRSQHILIKQCDHSFLDYDSYVDCSKLQKRPYQDVYKAIVKNPKIVVGNVTDEMLRQIHLKITYNETISEKEKKEFGFWESTNP
jgi:hypothetical protein